MLINEVILELEKIKTEHGNIKCNVCIYPAHCITPEHAVDELNYIEYHPIMGEKICWFGNK